MLTKPGILDVLVRENTELRQRGRYYWGLCPFHSEKTASFCVDTERQRFKCYECGQGGDSIDFIMKYKGFSFRDALVYLGISDGCEPVKSSKLELKKQKLLQRFRRWEQLYRRALSELVRIANRVDLQVASPKCFDLLGGLYHNIDNLKNIITSKTK